MYKQLLFLIVIIFLTGCAQHNENEKNIWDNYTKKTSTSSKLHSELVKIHNRDSLAFIYSPYRADFKKSI